MRVPSAPDRASDVRKARTRKSIAGTWARVKSRERHSTHVRATGIIRGGQSDHTCFTLQQDCHVSVHANAQRVPDDTTTQPDRSQYRHESPGRIDRDRRNRNCPFGEYSPWNCRSSRRYFPSEPLPILPLKGRSEAYQPRRPVDTGGFFNVLGHLPQWKPDASLEEISNIYRGLGYKNIEVIDRSLSDSSKSDEQRLTLLISKAILFNFEGEPNRALRGPRAGTSLGREEPQTG